MIELARDANCLDIVVPAVEALGPEDRAILQVFGGVGSAALGRPDVEIITEEKTVFVPALYQSRYRSREGEGDFGGGLRDYDAILKTTDKARVANAEKISKGVIGKGLDVSIFGVRQATQLEKQRRSALRGLKTKVGDRYAEERDGELVDPKKALYPFAVDMDPATLQTWKLKVGNDVTLPIPDPRTNILNYLTRDPCGLRPKDHAKVTTMTDIIRSQVPDLRDWLFDGPGKSQIELARILHTMRQSPGTKPEALHLSDGIVIEPYTLDELQSHSALMIEGDPEYINRIIGLARFKSRAVYKGASNKWVVDKWQKYIVPIIDVKNK